MSLSKLFNRLTPEGEPLLRVFQGLWDLADAKLQASLENVAIDHRVDQGLETEFSKFAAHPPSGLQPDELSKVLTGWIESYKLDFKRRWSRPAFTGEANRNNRLPDVGGGDPVAAASRPRSLVTLVKSTYCSSDLSKELPARFPGRNDWEYQDAEAQFAMCLENEDLFREAFAAAWEAKVRVKAQHPKWAANYEDFVEHSYEERSSDHWEMLFGKAPGSSAYIVALCAYESGHIGTLYRPTIIDADANHLHYPSPPWIESGRGGLTVALGECLTCQPLSEFVHLDVAYRPEHFLAFQLHAPAKGVIDWQLARTRHREKLRNSYPERQEEFTVWEEFVTVA